MGKKSRQAALEQEPQPESTTTTSDIAPAVAPVESGAAQARAAKKSSKRKLAVTDTTEQPAHQQGTADNEHDAHDTADEQDPPLSHKERRLAKRQKLKSTNDIDTDNNVSSNSKADKKATTLKVGATPAKSAYGVWIGNLTYTTTSQQLLAWLAERGLQDVTRVNMPKGKRSHEHNKGYVYIDFATEAERDIAVGLSEQHLDGRKLLIKASTDFTGRPAAAATATAVATAALGLDGASATSKSAIASSSAHAEGATGQTLSRTARKILDRQKNPPGPTLFLGNLGFETTIEDIKELFDAHQRAAAAWTPKKKDAGGREDKSAKKAKDKQEDDVKTDGADASDDDADPKSEPEEAQESKEPENEEGDDDEKDPEEQAKDAAEGEAKPKRVRSKKRRKQDGEGDEQQPAPEPVSDAGIKKVRLGTFEDSGKCKGWAFVDFKTPEHATRALLNPRNHTLAGRSLNVEYASLDAVRRGGFKVPGAPPRHKKDSSASQEGAPARQRGDKRKAQVLDDSAVRQSASSMDFGVERTADARTTVYDDSVPPPKVRARRTENGSRDAGSGKRAKPGAALASAQRASEAIVASRGKKIVFE
ncbi:Nucleolar protein 13 [Microbotryomycetes sp. JL201]|nr:Nucleolar protein 13 [Microbotryomycetes sp. JL201]